MNHNMDRFLDFILMEMTAEKFRGLLMRSDIPYEEALRIARLAQERENELVANHAMYPNEY